MEAGPTLLRIQETISFSVLPPVNSCFCPFLQTFIFRLILEEEKSGEASNSVFLCLLLLLSGVDFGEIVGRVVFLQLLGCFGVLRGEGLAVTTEHVLHFKRYGLTTRERRIQRGGTRGS